MADLSLTRLSDGRVLIVGRRGVVNHRNAGTSAAIVFDPRAPARWQWCETAGPAIVRSLRTATRLRDGRVLVVGGRDVADSRIAEVYDPATGRWSRTGALAQQRWRHAAALLGAGEVALVGGWTGDAGDWGVAMDPVPVVEIFDPATGRSREPEPKPRELVGHTVTTTTDGAVLIAGGRTGSAPTTDACRLLWPR